MTMVIVFVPKAGLFPLQITLQWLINGGYETLANWDDPPSGDPIVCFQKPVRYDDDLWWGIVLPN